MADDARKRADARDSEARRSLQELRELFIKSSLYSERDEWQDTAPRTPTKAHTFENESIVRHSVRIGASAFASFADSRDQLPSSAGTTFIRSPPRKPVGASLAGERSLDRMFAVNNLRQAAT